MAKNLYLPEHFQVAYHELYIETALHGQTRILERISIEIIGFQFLQICTFNTVSLRPKVTVLKVTQVQ